MEGAGSWGLSGHVMEVGTLERTMQTSPRSQGSCPTWVSLALHPLSRTFILFLMPKGHLSLDVSQLAKLKPVSPFPPNLLLLNSSHSRQ